MLRIRCPGKRSGANTSRRHRACRSPHGQALPHLRPYYPTRNGFIGNLSEPNSLKMQTGDRVGHEDSLFCMLRSDRGLDLTTHPTTLRLADKTKSATLFTYGLE